MWREIGGITELGGMADDLRVPDVDVAAAAESKEAGTMGASGTAVVWRFQRTGWAGEWGLSISLAEQQRRDGDDWRKSGLADTPIARLASGRLFR
jgi:hypothetical protein